MTMRLLRSLVFVLCVAGLSHSALALRVYVLSCGEKSDDRAVLNVISNAGHKAVLGPELSGWDGTQANLSKFNAVVFLYSYNYNAPDMPLAGQASLRAFVKAGGGLITGEWTLYETDGTNGELQVLQPYFPAVYKGNYIHNTNALFTSVTPDPVLNNNLPATFGFLVEDVGGTQSKIRAKTGATVYYMASSTSAGLVGWKKGKGRVLNYSTTLTSTELSNKKFRRLFLNSLLWVSAGSIP